MISALPLLIAASLAATAEVKPVLVLTGNPVAGEEREAIVDAHRDGNEALKELADKKGWIFAIVGTSVLFADPASLGLSGLDLRIDILKCLHSGKSSVQATEAGALGSTVQEFLSFTYAGQGLDVRGKDFTLGVTPYALIAATQSGSSKNLQSLYGPAEFPPASDVVLIKGGTAQPVPEPPALRPQPFTLSELFLGARTPVLQATARAEASEWIKQQVRAKQEEADALMSQLQENWPKPMRSLIAKLSLGGKALKDLPQAEQDSLEAMLKQNRVSDATGLVLTGGYLGVAVRVSLRTDTGETIRTQLVLRL